MEDSTLYMGQSPKDCLLKIQENMTPSTTLPLLNLENMGSSEDVATAKGNTVEDTTLYMGQSPKDCLLKIQENMTPSKTLPLLNLENMGRSEDVATAKEHFGVNPIPNENYSLLSPQRDATYANFSSLNVSPEIDDARVFKELNDLRKNIRNRRVSIPVSESQPQSVPNQSLRLSVGTSNTYADMELTLDSVDDSADLRVIRKEIKNRFKDRAKNLGEITEPLSTEFLKFLEPAETSDIPSEIHDVSSTSFNRSDHLDIKAQTPFLSRIMKHRRSVTFNLDSVINEIEKLPTANEEILPTASGEKLPTASKEKLPTASGEKLPTASGEKLPTASGEKLPTASGEKLPTASKEKLPTASGEKLPTANEEKLPTANEVLQSSIIGDNIIQSEQDESKPLFKNSPKKVKKGESETNESNSLKSSSDKDGGKDKEELKDSENAELKDRDQLVELELESTDNSLLNLKEKQGKMFDNEEDALKQAPPRKLIVKLRSLEEELAEAKSRYSDLKISESVKTILEQQSGNENIKKWYQSNNAGLIGNISQSSRVSYDKSVDTNTLADISGSSDSISSDSLEKDVNKNLIEPSFLKHRKSVNFDLEFAINEIIQSQSTTKSTNTRSTVTTDDAQVLQSTITTGGIVQLQNTDSTVISNENAPHSVISSEVLLDGLNRSGDDGKTYHTSRGNEEKGSRVTENMNSEELSRRNLNTAYISPTKRQINTRQTVQQSPLNSNVSSSVQSSPNASPRSPRKSKPYNETLQSPLNSNVSSLQQLSPNASPRRSPRKSKPYNETLQSPLNSNVSSLQQLSPNASPRRSPRKSKPYNETVQSPLNSNVSSLQSSPNASPRRSPRKSKPYNDLDETFGNPSKKRKKSILASVNPENLSFITESNSSERTTGDNRNSVKVFEGEERLNTTPNNPDSGDYSGSGTRKSGTTKAVLRSGTRKISQISDDSKKLSQVSTRRRSKDLSMPELIPDKSSDLSPTSNLTKTDTTLQNPKGKLLTESGVLNSGQDSRKRRVEPSSPQDFEPSEVYNLSAEVSAASSADTNHLLLKKSNPLQPKKSIISPGHNETNRSVESLIFKKNDSRKRRVEASSPQDFEPSEVYNLSAEVSAASSADANHLLLKKSNPLQPKKSIIYPGHNETNRSVEFKKNVRKSSRVEEEISFAEKANQSSKRDEQREKTVQLDKEPLSRKTSPRIRINEASHSSKVSSKSGKRSVILQRNRSDTRTPPPNHSDKRKDAKQSGNKQMTLEHFLKRFSKKDGDSPKLNLTTGVQEMLKRPAIMESLPSENATKSTPKPTRVARTVTTNKELKKKNFSLQSNRSLFQHYCKHKVSVEGAKAFHEAMENFLKNLSSDLEVILTAKGDKIINQHHLYLLMKELKLIRSKNELYCMMQEYLPVDEWKKYIPVQYAFQKTYPLKSKTDL